MKSNSKTITEEWLRTYIENKVKSDPSITNPDDAKKLLWGAIRCLIGKQLK